MDYKKFYSKEFRDRWKILAETKEPWLIERINTALELAKPKRGDKILDVGCGDGVITILAAKRGAFVTGIDLSLPSIKSARSHAKKERVNDRTSFLASDIYNLPFKTESFDKVICTEVLEHLEKPLAALHEIRRVLKKRGKLIVSVPTAFHPSHLMELGHGDEKVRRGKIILISKGLASALACLLSGKGHIETRWRGAPHYHYFPATLKSILSKGGFKVLKSRPLIFIPKKYGEKIGAIRKIGELFEKSSLGPYICMTNNLVCEKI